jgi:hypothetical protein
MTAIAMQKHTGPMAIPPAAYFPNGGSLDSATIDQRRFVEWLELRIELPKGQVVFVPCGDDFQTFGCHAQLACESLPGLAMTYGDVLGKRAARLIVDQRLIDAVMSGLVDSGVGVAIAVQVDDQGNIAVIRNHAAAAGSRPDCAVDAEAAVNALPTPVRKIANAMLALDHQSQRTACSALLSWINKYKTNGSWQNREDGWPPAWRNTMPSPAMMKQALSVMASLPQKHHRDLVKLLRRIRQALMQVSQTARSPFDENSDTARTLELARVQPVENQSAAKIMDLLSRMSPDNQRRVARSVASFYELCPEPWRSDRERLESSGEDEQ